MVISRFNIGWEGDWLRRFIISLSLCLCLSFCVPHFRRLGLLPNGPSCMACKCSHHSTSGVIKSNLTCVKCWHPHSSSVAPEGREMLECCPPCRHCAVLHL